jgi:hypothetical protein
MAAIAGGRGSDYVPVLGDLVTAVHGVPPTEE